MTTAEEDSRECLNFKLQGTPSDLASWGHEYVRHLAGEIGDEYNQRLADAKKPDVEKKGTAEDLLPLILEHMVPFFVQHNAEAEAIDLLSEVGMLDELVQHVDKTNCERVVMYLSQVALYVPEPEDAQVLGVAVAALRKIGRHAEAMRLAVRAPAWRSSRNPRAPSPLAPRPLPPRGSRSPRPSPPSTPHPLVLHA